MQYTYHHSSFDFPFDERYLDVSGKSGSAQVMPVVRCPNRAPWIGTPWRRIWRALAGTIRWTSRCRRRDSDSDGDGSDGFGWGMWKMPWVRAGLSRHKKEMGMGGFFTPTTWKLYGIGDLLTAYHLLGGFYPQWYSWHFLTKWSEGLANCGVILWTKPWGPGPCTWLKLFF